ncbi:MAG: DUF1761 domain-containing protein [Candidatus Peribacteraceae bacterium]
MDFSMVNLAAVLVAAAVAFIIGFLWHGPLFGKQWMTLMEIPQSKVDAMKAQGMGPMVPRMVAAYVQQCVIAFVVSYLATMLAVTDAVSAIYFAVLLWFGFIATVLLNTVLWEERKMNLYLFNVTYHLVTLIAITLVVVLW